MIFRDVYRPLLKKRLETNDEIITYNESFIKDAINAFSKHPQAAIYFLKNECTADEYIWISEIIDDIAAKSKNLQLVETYAALADKYPQETKEYNIQSFINSAISIAKS